MIYLVIGKAAYFLLIGILLMLIYQRKYGAAGERKRFSVLYLGIAVLAIYAVSFLHALPAFAGNPLPLAAVAAIIAGVLYFKREKVFIFRSRCNRCGTKIGPERRFFIDSNLCETCEKEASPPAG